MSYNRNYRQQVSQPGRYNSPGQFVSSGEMNTNQGTPTRTTRSTAATATTNFSNLVACGQYPSGSNPPPPPPPPQSAPAAPAQQYQTQQIQPQQQQQQQEETYSEEVEPKSEVMDTSVESDATATTRSRPHWMKPNMQLGGIAKKISNKERRRRQNEHLRRLLTPKNALMVLHELMPGEQLTQNITVEAAPTNTQFFRQDANHKFCAGLAVDGNIYKGFGENKMVARNAAAEQAIRDMVIKRMAKFSKLLIDQTTGEGMETNGADENGTANAAESEVEPLPMIQLASYALHKLFSEWQYEGYQVPLLPKNSSASSTADKMEDVLSSPMAPKPKPSKKAKGPRELPADAAFLHPCMLLTHMRQGLVYHELGSEGDKPQNMMFTMGVTVDGTTYIGKAANKKEARKQAARQACQALFSVSFADPANAVQ